MLKVYHIHFLQVLQEYLAAHSLKVDALKKISKLGNSPGIFILVDLCLCLLSQSEALQDL